MRGGTGLAVGFDGFLLDCLLFLTVLLHGVVCRDEDGVGVHEQEYGCMACCAVSGGVGALGLLALEVGVVAFLAPLGGDEVFAAVAAGGDFDELGVGFPLVAVSGAAVDGYTEGASDGFFISLHFVEGFGV